MIIDNIRSVQRELNLRKSRMFRIIREMTEFKERMTTKSKPMGLLERAIMVVRAKSIYVKRISVTYEARPNLSNPKECFKRALNAKRIVKYKQSDLWFGTWIVWYV